MPASLHASEDYYTTDFLYPVQPLHGAYHLFYSNSWSYPGQDITGSVSTGKWGADAAPFRGLDLFYVGEKMAGDLKRTNRYQFSMAGSNFGFKVALLPEERNWLGLSAGACWESYTPGDIFKNDINLKVQNPKETSRYYFVLGTKKLRENLWLSGGSKWGTVDMGPRKLFAYNASANLDWQINTKLMLSGNLKYYYLEDYPGNWNPSLRLNYKPAEPFYLQAHVGYYSHGLHSVAPIMELVVPEDMMKRYGEKGQLYFGGELSVQF